MAVLADADLDMARKVLGDHRFDQRLEAVTAYCGAGFPRNTFLDVLSRLRDGSLVLHFRTDGSYEVRPGRRVTGRTGQARRG